MSPLTPEEKEYLTVFRDFEAVTSDPYVPWLSKVRREAISRFAALGLPTQRQEEWKYTNLDPLRRKLFKPAVHGGDRAGADIVSEWSLDEADGNEIRWHNGAPVGTARVSRNGLYMDTITRAAETEREWIEPYLSREARRDQEALVALNTAFMEAGAVVRLEAGRPTGLPIHLCFLAGTTAAGRRLAIHSRNLIVVGDGSHMTLVETHAGSGDGDYWTNAVTEVVLGENAVVDHYRLQFEHERSFHTAAIEIRQGRNSVYRSHLFSLGGRLTRTALNVVLAGEGADCTLNGFYMVGRDQHVDTRTEIDHLKPHASSRELYKGILGGRARGVFNGKIIVRPDAQKTDARQANKNLVISKDAEVNSKPQLEIEADDVKCSHGTTIGQIEEAELFYLRSRGLSAAEARGLLVHGFANEMLARLALSTIRRWLEQRISSKLAETQR